ncbi:MAG: amidohydrolase, partial [Gemmatimonadetes bacterium]|nr:amidohydrolase [Gemmatimonadota bacterium]
MRRAFALPALVCLWAAPVYAQAPNLSPEVRQFVSVEAPVVALTHVRVVDGMGAPPAEDQTILLENGRIKAIGKTGELK